MSEFDDVYALYENAGDQDDGYNKWETNREYLHEKFRTSEVLIMRNADNNEVMAATPFFESPACRSTKAMLCTVYAMVNPKYRGHGVIVELYDVSEKFSMDCGYIGVNSRAYVTGRNILPTRRFGAMVTGFIPYCSNVEKLGIIDDVLLVKDYKISQIAPDYYKVGQPDSSRLL